MSLIKIAHTLHDSLCDLLTPQSIVAGVAAILNNKIPGRSRGQEISEVYLLALLAG
jgi:hypothetical protein